jgi:hypothetical protein
MDIPLLLSGTFGELRNNHFHAGLDLKTQLKEGLNIYTAAPGYVSRIKISHWGYGKALYITHPNGFTTVYAHLRNFNDKIEDYIKKKQYEKESFEIEVFPAASDLQVSEDELIAFSGSTGGFVGPHLHFEIRDTKTEKPINPLYFGIKINDDIKPRINTLVGYTFSSNSHINKIAVPSQLNLRVIDSSNLAADEVTAFGKIGFGINAFDLQNGAPNKNGLYSLELFVNGEKKHEFLADSFSFFETKYINLLIDYERLDKIGQRVQKCFTHPLSPLGIISQNSNGIIEIEDGKNYTVQIIAKDFSGNSQTITIPVKGKNDDIIVKKEEIETPFKINREQFNKFSKNGVSAAFPKNTFYSNLYLNFDVIDSIAQIHTAAIPLHNNYTLTFDVSHINPDKRKFAYIASIDNNGKIEYEKTTKKEQTFYTTTKNLGKFTIAYDFDAPIVQAHNFKNEQWISAHKTLKVKINDSGSGIKSYRGEINGQWILMEYNVKTGLLTYNLSDKVFDSSRHELTIEVTDNVDNTTVFKTNFYKKY